jgi:RHS repeat-associated protein
VYGIDSDPIAGVKVYLFTASGAYQGINATTDANGQVVFNLPDQEYKVRADYLSGQYWSDVFIANDIAVDIDHGYADINVTDLGVAVDGVNVYLFKGTGAYLGRYNVTDGNGQTSFLIPTGAYKFRVDYSGTQYWSDVVNILASEETAVDLALDLLALDGTKNPHPVRFDGTPPEREPVMLASLMGISGILNQSVVAATGTDALYWFINDHLGTPQKVIDADQAIVWEGSQEPFGSTTVTTNTLDNKFRFPGQYFDTESGLHYNYHRYYDPSSGRYITSDPIGLTGGINLYAYAYNDPVNLIDPYGLRYGGGYALRPEYDPGWNEFGGVSGAGAAIGAAAAGAAYYEITKNRGGDPTIYKEEKRKFKEANKYRPPNDEDPDKNPPPPIGPTVEQQLKREPWLARIWRILTSQFSEPCQ